MSESESKVYSVEEVAKHSSRDDLWMVISGKVYDVTKFVDEHPGGEEVLVDCAGRDATSEFDDVGHSEDAETILKGLYVGQADPVEFATKSSSKGPSTTYAAGEATSSGGASSLIYLIIAAFVAAGAYFYLQA